MQGQYKLNIKIVKKSLRAEHKIHRQVSNGNDTLQKVSHSLFKTEQQASG